MVTSRLVCRGIPDCDRPHCPSARPGQAVRRRGPAGTFACYASWVLCWGMTSHAGTISYSDTKNLKLDFDTSSIVIPPKYTVSYGGSIGASDRTVTMPGSTDSDSSPPMTGPDLSTTRMATSPGQANAMSHAMNQSSLVNPPLTADGQVEVDGKASAFANPAKFVQATASSSAREVANVTEISSGVIVESRAVNLSGSTGNVRPGGPAFGSTAVDRDPLQMTVYNVTTGATLATASILQSDAMLHMGLNDVASGVNPTLSWNTTTGVLSVSALSTASIS